MGTARRPVRACADWRRTGHPVTDRRLPRALARPGRRVLLAADGQLLGQAMLTAVASPPTEKYTPAVGATARGEEVLIARLQAGDEAAFRELVREHHRAMRRVAMSYVQTVAAADEVVQETWLAVIRGLAKFEGRSSLKTWIFRILVNRAQTRGARERRSVPVASLA